MTAILSTKPSDQIIEKNEELNKEYNDILSTIDKDEENLYKARSILSMCKEKNMLMEKKVRTEKRTKAKALKDLNKLVTTVKTLQANPSAEQTNSKITQDLKILRTKSTIERDGYIQTINNLKKEIVEGKEAVQKLSDKLSYLIRDITNAQNDISYKKNTISDLKHQEESITNKSIHVQMLIDEHTKQCEELTHIVSKLNNTLKDTKTSEETARIKLMRKKKHYQRLKERLKNIAIAAKEKIEQTKIECEKKKEDEHARCMISLQQKDQLIESLKRQITEKNQTINSISGQIKAIENDSELMRAKFSQIKQQYETKMSAMQQMIDVFSKTNSS